jgi:hypothetical protein
MKSKFIKRLPDLNRLIEDKYTEALNWIRKYFNLRKALHILNVISNVKQLDDEIRCLEKSIENFDRVREHIEKGINSLEY